jgi:beta-fructofuranosidase
MPFFHDGVFHLFYLLDENHHQGLGGLGGHQWAHASTTDLQTWQEHPLALPITEDWEGSICTGSTFFYGGLYHAFYATRRRDWTQHLSHAISRDGIYFEKDTVPLAFPPPGYSPFHFRDPFVFRTEDGRFQMLVTAQIEDFPLHERGGCLLRLSSADLQDWQVEGPLLIPGGEPGYACIPECADLFEWNGWYYLLFGLKLHTHYRMARSPLGPWLRPAVDTLDNPMLAVMKTAPFGDHRRIGAGWIPTREGNLDNGRTQWGGNLVLRELVQLQDGSLGTRFLPETLPPGGDVLRPAFQPLSQDAVATRDGIRLSSQDSLAVGEFHDLPADYNLRCRVLPEKGIFRFGLGLRGKGAFEQFAELAFEPHNRRARLGLEMLDGVAGLDRPFDLQITVKDDLFDVCIANSRCLINRLPEQHGDSLFFFCENGAVTFGALEIQLVW